MAQDDVRGPALQHVPLLDVSHHGQRLRSIHSSPSDTASQHSTSQIVPRPPIPLTIREVHPGTPNRKRARPTVSCLECRRKKLKCDRRLPCSQCVKGRREDLCQFASGLTKVGASKIAQSAIVPRAPEPDRAGKRMRIEDVMGPTNHVLVPHRDDGFDRESVPLQFTETQMRVEGDRSRLLGLSERTTLLDHFPNAKAYIVQSFAHPDTSAMMQELKTYQKSFQRRVTKVELELPTEPALLVAEMLQSLPSDGTLCSAFASYEAHWEGWIRIFHVPTFIKEVQTLEDFIRSNPSRGEWVLPSHIRESLVAQVLGVCVLAARIDGLRDSRSSEHQIATWMRLMESWLGGLDGKEQLKLQTLRTQILRLLCKWNGLIQTSQLWRESGNVLRSAMIMGLHGDIEDYDQFSVFEKEQRRKLWRTVVELDVHFSLTCNMPTAIRSTDFECRPLVNADDDAFKKDALKYPDGQPDHVRTDATPQAQLGASLRTRLDIANLLAGTMSVPGDVETLLSLARYLEHSIQTLPSPPPDKGSEQGYHRAPGRSFIKTIIDIQLRRPIQCIYQRIVLSTQGSRYPEARRGALRNAIAILSCIDALDPEVADPNTIRSRDQLNLFHVLCKRDILQAALILCLEIQCFSVLPPPHDPSSSTTIPGDEFHPRNKTSLTRIVENTLNSLLRRLGEFGSDLKDILPLSIVLQSARSDGNLDENKLLMRRGMERVLRSCREMAPACGTPLSTTTADATPMSDGGGGGGLGDVTNSNYAAGQPYKTYQPLPPFSADAQGSLFGPLGTPADAETLMSSCDFVFSDWDTTGSWF